MKARLLQVIRRDHADVRMPWRTESFSIGGP